MLLSKQVRPLLAARVLGRRAWRGAKRRLRLRVNSARRARAVLWNWIYQARFRILSWRARYGAPASTLLLLALIGVSSLWIPVLQDALRNRFITGAVLDASEC
jgi:hypothetical protein